MSLVQRRKPPVLTDVFHRPKTAACFAVGLSLAGCSSYSQIGNYRSSLDQKDAGLRAALELGGLSSPIVMRYKPGFCSYELTTRDGISHNDETRAISLSIKPFKSLLSVVVDDEEHKSSALIDRDGKVSDFNVWDKYAVDLGGYTPETQVKSDAAIQDIARESMRITESNPQVIKRLSAEFPYYEHALSKSGETVSYVRLNNGSVWGTYKFKGMTQYHGRYLAVLDLERIIPTLSNENIVVGYNLVDPETALPVLLAFSSGSKIFLRQISCTD